MRINWLVFSEEENLFANIICKKYETWNDYQHLTHWGPDEDCHFPGNIFKCIFLKEYKFRLRFHWSLFPMFQLTISQHWYKLLLDTVHATNHHLNQWLLVLGRIYASLGLNESKSTESVPVLLMLRQHWIKQWLVAAKPLSRPVLIKILDAVC